MPDRQARHGRTHGVERAADTAKAKDRELDKLLALLKADLPKATVAIDKPRNESGEWWIDLRHGRFATSVAWRPGTGFGVYTPRPRSDDGYGDRPNEVYRKAEQAARRLCQLASGGETRRPNTAMKLKDIRDLLGTPQTELARLMRSNQGAVSRLEARPDVMVSSLASYVQAMGGRLELRVRFDSFEAPIALPKANDAAKRPPARANAK